MASLIVEFFSQKTWLEREIDEHRRAQREIADQKDFINQVIDTDPSPIHVTDAQGHFILVNRAASMLFDASVEVLLQSNIRDFVNGPSATAFYESAARGDLSPGSSHETEETITTRFGKRRFQIIRCLFRRPDGQVHVLSIKLDITEREKAHQKVLEAKRVAEAAGRAKSEFLANVSHELRTPMHGILSYARFGLKETATASREDLLDFFTNIHDCGTGLLDLLNDLLDLSKLEAGRMQFDMQDTDLTLLIRNAADECAALIAEKGLELQFPEETESMVLQADGTRLLQVFRNLICNAMKFSKAGGVITISLERTGERMRAVVEDRGIGIPNEELELVFDKFSQSSRTKSAGGGTGLGLAISREIVEAHQGRIWAENRAGGGSRVIVELPASIAGESDAAAA